MDAILSNHTTPDSLKRKRDTLAENTKLDGRDKRRNTEKSDYIDQTNKAAAECTDEPTRAVGTNMSLNITTMSSDDASIDSILSNNITTSDDRTNKTNEAPPKPTLQTLPRELRDMIYEYVAATEERIVLGRRMIEERQKYSTLSLDLCFVAAVALHPLSMTCRQFLNEFQQVHFSAPNAPWILLVNNFELAQVQVFSDYIQEDLQEFILVTGYDDAVVETGTYKVPIYNRSVTLRFQMDDKAPYSASELCKEIYFEKRGNEPMCWDHWYSSIGPSIGPSIGIADIVTQYVPRTTAPVARRQSMTVEQGTDIESMFGTLYERILRLPDFLVNIGSVSLMDGYDYGEPSSPYPHMQARWFDQFSHAVKLMRKAKEAKESAPKAPTRS